MLEAARAVFALYRMTRRAVRAPSERRRAVVLPGGQYTGGQLYAAVRDQMDRDRDQMSGARPKTRSEDAPEH